MVKGRETNVWPRFNSRLFFDRADEDEFREVELPPVATGYAARHLKAGTEYRFQSKRMAQGERTELSDTADTILSRERRQ